MIITHVHNLICILSGVTHYHHKNIKVSTSELDHDWQHCSVAANSRYYEANVFVG